MPVFSGELQVLGEKSSVASLILENLRLCGLTPVGAFFLPLPEVCPAQGGFLTVTAPRLWGSLSRVPPFSSVVSPQEPVCHPVTDSVRVQIAAC